MKLSKRSLVRNGSLFSRVTRLSKHVRFPKAIALPSVHNELGIGICNPVMCMILAQDVYYLASLLLS